MGQVETATAPAPGTLYVTCGLCALLLCHPHLPTPQILAQPSSSFLLVQCCRA